jgi:peptide/nickel transport system permease protein
VVSVVRNREAAAKSGEERSVARELARQRPSFWKRFRRHRLALGGATVVAVLALVSLLAPVIGGHNPDEMNLGAVSQAPSWEHWLGTDMIGRDVLTRLLYAGRVSLSVGLVAVGIYMTIAIVIGSIAGFYRGWVDNLLMRITDAIMCFPTLIIIISIVAMVGPSIYNVMLVIGLLGWPSNARLVRGQILSLREREFVEAARCIGASDTRIVARHILPNIVAPLTVAATFGVAGTIMLEAGLSFLGLGVQPPTPSWGNMLNQAKSVEIIENMLWLWVPAGVMVAACVMSVNFIGDGLRDALDPRGKLNE